MNRISTPTSTKIIAETSSGEEITIMRIEKTESHIPDGTYKAFVSVFVHIPNEKTQDSFCFKAYDHRLSLNFLQTNEKNMGLLELYMAAIQDMEDLNEFIVSVADFMRTNFDLKDLMMVEA